MEDKDLKDLLIETQHELIKQYQDKVYLLEKLLVESNNKLSKCECHDNNNECIHEPIIMPIEPNRLYFVPPSQCTRPEPPYGETISVGSPSVTSSEVPIKFTLLK